MADCVLYSSVCIVQIGDFRLSQSASLFHAPLCMRRCCCLRAAWHAASAHVCGVTGQQVEGDIPAVKRIYFPLSVSHLHALSDKLRDTSKQAVADELCECSEEDGSVHAEAVDQEHKVSQSHHNSARNVKL